MYSVNVLLAEQVLEFFELNINSSDFDQKRLFEGDVTCANTGGYMGKICISELRNSPSLPKINEPTSNLSPMKSPAKRKVTNGSVSQMSCKIIKPKVTLNVQNTSAVVTSQANPDALITTSQNMSTGEKTFECSLCGYRSTDSKRNVSRHIDAKHLGTKFTCKTCGATAAVKYDMKKHYVTKHGLSKEAAEVMVA